MRPRALVLAALLGLSPGMARGADPPPVRNGPATIPTTTTLPVAAAADRPLAQLRGPSPAPDLAGLEGLPVSQVTVLLENDIWHDVRIPPLTSVKPGDPLTPTAARRAMSELLDSGRFSRARAIAVSRGDRAELVIRASPRKLIARIRTDFHGAPIDRDEVMRQSGLVKGGEIMADEIDGTGLRLEHEFQLHGYPSAKSRIRTQETDDPTHVLVLIDVVPGAPRLLDDRRFIVFGAAPERIAPIEAVYSVHARDRADEPTIDRADTALEQAMRSSGYYRAEVSHDLARLHEPGQPDRIELRVRIDTGPLFEPRFDGNEHYDADVLMAVLGLDSETDRSPSHLADKIRGFYQKRGFLDAAIRAETRGSESDLVELVVFHVSEGARVRVGKRSYPCLKPEVIKNLRAGGPRSPADIGTEIDSFLDEDLPGADLFVNPDPRIVSQTLGGASGQVDAGSLPAPLDLQPNETFVADTYDRAVEHVQELYRNEGFLHANVGPVQVVRARCSPRSPPQACIPMPVPPVPRDICGYESSGLPATTEPLGPAYHCRPDAGRGVTCAPTVDLVIPVRLGPRTQLWDLAFTGVKSFSEQAVAEAAQAPLGEAASTTKLEDARRRIIEWYKERGYYYVDVKYALESSADRTRARVRFDVTEGEQVTVRAIVINGLEKTSEGVVRRRIALDVGGPYRTSDVRKTQERIATLGVFASVTVALSDPYVPQAVKDVVIDVVERDSQYVEVRPGFSTGEGVRGVLEYGHRNLLGYAWSMTLHLQASYLPDFLILDEGVRRNYRTLSTTERIATRDTLTFSWPEVGLGPTVRTQLDGIYVLDLERDFTLRKAATVGTIIWRPSREFQVSAAADYENNDVFLFNGQTIAQYLQSSENQGNTELATLLRVPDGDSNAVAGRVVFTWDRRDSAFNAHRGTYFASGIEEVNSYPAGSPPLARPGPVNRARFSSPVDDVLGQSAPLTLPAQQYQYQSNFFRLTETVAGYVPISSRVTFAAEIRLGLNIVPWCSERPAGSPPHSSCTYPDRLFFMGGFDSMRGWLQDSFIPQDYVDQISRNPSLCTNNQSNCPGVGLRGANLMINPRFELRFPIRLPIEGAVFSDFGNLWDDPTYIFHHTFQLRADVGAGVRVDTPVGPLVFDYGVNILRHPYEDFGAFHFAIGLF
ncbi:MAG: POTRA domain-containing protein [Polyangiaceae bacterium]|jgi:outer membrane protein assembly factor BamA